MDDWERISGGVTDLQKLPVSSKLIQGGSAWTTPTFMNSGPSPRDRRGAEPDLVGLASGKTVATFAGGRREFSFSKISHFLSPLNQLSFLDNLHLLSSTPTFFSIRVIGDARRGHP